MSILRIRADAIASLTGEAMIRELRPALSPGPRRLVMLFLEPDSSSVPGSDVLAALARVVGDRGTLYWVRAPVRRQRLAVWMEDVLRPWSWILGGAWLATYLLEEALSRNSGVTPFDLQPALHVCGLEANELRFDVRVDLHRLTGESLHLAVGELAGIGCDLLAEIPTEDWPAPARIRKRMKVGSKVTGIRGSCRRMQAWEGMSEDFLEALSATLL